MTEFDKYEHLKSDSNIGKPELETLDYKPNKNAMKFDQIDGCCDIIEKLLNELIPKTSQVEGCIITHKSWRANNLKHLRGAFE